MLYGAGLEITKARLAAEVLILIFLENALRLADDSAYMKSLILVLILIFLENALRHNLKQAVRSGTKLS